MRAGPPGFTIQAPLGQGGMGQVYVARDPLGREVALKLLPRAQVTERGAARFAREAELLARVQHPGVVGVHAWGELDEALWLSCDLVRGQHIDHAARTLPLEGQLDLIEQLAQALAAVHGEGLVHRDLKPANVLVGDDGRVRLIDFGVATGSEVERLTRTGGFVGTPLYAPPERVFPDPDLDPDQPTGDVWALAAIAWELLTGERYNQAEGLHDFHSQLSRRAPSIRTRVPALGRPLARLLTRALSPNPAERPRDAGAFAAAWAEARAARDRAGLPLPLAALALAAIGAAAWLAWPEPTTAPAVATSPAPAASDPPEKTSPAPSPASSPEPSAIPPAALDALRAGDVAAAEAAGLDPLHPMLVIERERQDLDPARTPDLLTIGRLEALVRRSAHTDARDPIEVFTRVQETVSQLVWTAVQSALLIELPQERYAALLGDAAALPGDSGPTLALLRLQVEIALALLKVGASTDPFRKAYELIDASADLPAWGPWADRLPPMRRAAALSLILTQLACRERPAPPELLPLITPALADLDPSVALDGFYSRFLAMAALLLERDAAARGFARGTRQVAQGHIKAALAYEPWLPEQDIDTVLQVAGVYLTGGRFRALRQRLNQLREQAPGRIAAYQGCLIELDLAEGKLAAARDRLDRLLGKEHVGDNREYPLLLRQRLHLEVLEGLLTPAEALARLPGLPPLSMGPSYATRLIGLRWRTDQGLRDVLEGGWWPGRTKGR